MTIDVTVLMGPLFWGMTAAVLLAAIAIVLGGWRAEGTPLGARVGQRSTRRRSGGGTSHRGAGRRGLPTRMRWRQASHRARAV